MLLEQVASQLDILPEKLERDSLRVYLERDLRLVESELFTIASRYGVSTVAELDQKVQSGIFHEEDAFEDFFRLDHLEVEREKLVGLLRNL
jgi:hypothetical protein